MKHFATTAGLAGLVGPLGCLVAVVLCCPTVSAGAAEDNPEKSAAEMITPATDRAVGRGLALLAARQHGDGSFGTGNYRGNAAITGLAGMAMLCSGSSPQRGPYGRQVQRCIDYLLANTQQSGLIVAPGSTSRGPMYGHGFAVLFLAECYGMTPRPELREKLARAVKLIVNTQNNQGGWRYQPQRHDADISVTICQVMALRAARNAGFSVPAETIKSCTTYVKQCQNSDGGFRYMLEGERESGFERSAAGVVALFSAGVYEGPEVDNGIEYLMKFIPTPGVVRREPYYYYGHYYAVQAMWQVGGDSWNLWYPAIRDELLARQRRDGAWPSSHGTDYGTGMACIILQLPNNYLPIFQR